MIVTWNADPVLLHLGPIEIRWYGALFAAALLVGFWIMGRIYRREGQDERELDPLSLYAVLGVVIGARLGHVLFYDPGFYFTHPLEILKVWKGGLASHGAGIGLFIALYLFTRRYPTHSYLWLLDRLTLPAALGGAFIRLGNFFNSEILGKPTGADWGIIFARVDSIPRHPVQLYESLGYLVIFLVLLATYRRRTQPPPSGALFGLFLALVFAFRFLVEFLKEPQESYSAGVLTVGQWLSIPFVIAGLIFLVIATKRRGA